MHEKIERNRRKQGAKSCFIGQPGSGGLFKHNRICLLSKNLWITRPEQLSRVHVEEKGGKKTIGVYQHTRPWLNAVFCGHQQMGCNQYCGVLQLEHISP